MCTHKDYSLSFNDFLNSRIASPTPRPNSGSFLPPNKTNKMTNTIINSVEPILGNVITSFHHISNIRECELGLQEAKLASIKMSFGN